MTSSRRWVVAVAAVLLAGFSWPAFSQGPGPAIAADAATRPATDTAATLITLHHANANVEQVLGDLAGQMGLDYSVSGYSGGPISLDVDRKPYWEVLPVLRDKLQLRLVPSPDGKLDFRGGFGGGYFYVPGIPKLSGAFMLYASAMSHSIRYGQAPDREDDCTLGIMLCGEPRILIQTFEPVAVPDVAVDENGLSLVPAHAPAVFPQAHAENSNRRDASTTEFGVRLALPAKVGYRLAKVKGSLKLTVAAEVAHIEWPRTDPLPTVPGTELTVSGRNGGVELTARSTGGPWAENLLLLHCARIVGYDAKEVAVPMAMGSSSGSSNTYKITYGRNPIFYSGQSDSKIGEPVRFVLTIPTKLQEVAVPYEFTDLPLP